jgi:hypothetical protein
MPDNCYVECHILTLYAERHCPERHYAEGRGASQCL